MTWIIATLFLVIAIVYSSVGFGGGSMYLAVLSFTALSQDSLRITALICNALVSAAGSWHFFGQCRIAARRVIPLLACSIPTCILTSTFKISDTLFFGMLAIALIIAGLLMLIRFQQTDFSGAKNPWYFFPLAAAIGGLAGITGIGGGVYLSPFLYLRNWGTAKEISAVSAIFIFVNSIAGLLTRVISLNGNVVVNDFYLFIVVAMGGFLGSYFSSKKWPDTRVREVTAIILIIAGLRILISKWM
jgi:uncharacterized membrane protein YfcA